MSEHRMTVHASWHGSSQTGAGELSAEVLRSTYSIARELGGPGNGTNPEELVLGAAASCYLITLAVMLGKRGVPFDSLEVTTDGTVLFDKGLQLLSLSHHPRITLSATATVEHREAALAAAELAERGCMVSRAMRGNVATSAHPVVVVAPAIDAGTDARALQA
jgi:peroxiredoxin-like protein